MDIAALGIEVDTRGLKRGNEELGKLPNAARRAETATARMAREVNQLDRQMRAFSVGGFEGAAGRAMEASANMGRSMQLAGHQVGNMAAQFQDIGVSLASGQSPFLVAIQQGSQLSQIIGPMGLRGGLAALGTGLVAMVNPVNLFFLGLAAAGAAGTALFSMFRSEAPNAEEALKRHKSLIDEIAQAYPEAAAAAEAYGQRTAQALAQSLQTEIADIQSQMDALAAGMAETTRSSGSALLIGMEGSSVVDTVSQVQQAVDDFVASVISGKPAFGDLKGELSAIGATNADAGIEALISQILDGTGPIGAFVEQLRALSVTLNALPGTTPGPLTNSPRMAEEASMEAYRDELGIGTSTATVDRIAREAEAAAKASASKAASAAKTAQNEAERRAKALADERAGIDDLINGLHAEKAMIGATATEQRLYNELKSAGANATSSQIQQIEALVPKLVAEQEAYDDLISRMDGLRSTARGVFSGMADDMRSGASAGEMLNNVLSKINDRLVDIGVNALTDAAFGKQGTASPGFMGNIFASLFGGGQASTVPSLTGAGLFHSGGMVGLGGAMRYVHPSYFDDAPRMHRGGLMSDERAAILQTGERVLSREEVARPGASMKVEIIDQRTNAPAVERQERQGPNGERIIRAIIRDEVVNGGAGRGFAKAHGLKRPGVRT